MSRPAFAVQDHSLENGSMPPRQEQGLALQHGKGPSLAGKSGPVEGGSKQKFVGREKIKLRSYHMTKSSEDSGWAVFRRWKRASWEVGGGDPCDFRGVHAESGQFHNCFLSTSGCQTLFQN